MNEDAEKRASLNPFSNEEVCHICQEPFSINNIRKTCRHCGSFVCIDHSAKKKWIDDTLSRMCDKCRFNKTRLFLISQSAPKLNELKSAISQISLDNERLSKEIKEVKIWESEINIKFKENKLDHEKTCSKIEPKIEEVVEENERLIYAISNYKKVIEDREKLILERNKYALELENELKKAENEKETDAQKCENLAKNIKTLKSINQNSIVMPAIESCTCEECKIKLFGTAAIKSQPKEMKSNQKCYIF
ncbi:unnamed protein product [Blepharisma stoltei]|uniref:FYVE-type domain-containing protein n=1 Tax=Blepharisma stoltei TaxID=1481888 RepID=A0AAU9J244_9CILI|nr:unnamed protein product [Blepharisma stoltei]